jgi:gliding motility-associated-like protein
MTTMLLSGDAISNEENHLQWNAFAGFDAGVKQYRIFRMSNPGEPILVIDSVNPGAGVLEYTYTDQLAGQFIKSGVVTYWIEAQENSGNSYGFQEQSLSNRLTFAQETGLYMPTGFRPGGLTPGFKPVFLFFNGKSYLFQIYNRWGQMIFETHSSDEGWDGTNQGSVVPTGTYLYRLVYQNYNGQQTEQRGAFTVVN